MLVLTRKPGEQVLIGDDIVITVLESRGDSIRIGIDAPRGIRVQRAEIIKAVTDANVEATTADPDAEAQLKAALGIANPAPVDSQTGTAPASADPASGNPAAANPAPNEEK